jgi:hypothetical protein
MGTLLFLTFAVAVTALVISLYTALNPVKPATVVTQVAAPKVVVSPTTEPTATPSASVSPTKKVTTAPLRTVNPVVSVSPTVAK